MKFTLPLVVALCLPGLFAKAVADNVLRPGDVAFGAGVDQIRAQLMPTCSKIDSRAFDPPQLPGAETSHIQLDCAGYPYGGKPRLAEFVFRDDQLVLVWILIDEGELAGADMVMRQLLGSPSHASDIFTAFTHERTALRKDKPEFLFYAPEMGPMFETWFSQNGNQ